MALRFVEAREGRGRRFGADAEGRWEQFHGAMGASERIDLLLRDADAQWPRAFAPRVVFVLRGLAADEPFGPSWAGLTPKRGEELWREVMRAPELGEVRALVTAVAAAWERTLEVVPLPEVTPTSRLIVAGASAIGAAIEVFARRGELSWDEQVLVVAEAPLDRQLAGMASAILSAGGPTQMVGPTERAQRPFARAELVISKDADAGVRDAAEKIHGGE
ncbi:MAG: hypothetical protein IPK72_22630 [Candidatus Eisenbacteria bacterium]|nr:hypothetical protein [Candidatus Eisenbacteria bacterium]